MKSTIKRQVKLDKYRAIIALLLIVPISSIGALMSTLIAPGIIGQIIAVSCGIWLVSFPWLWSKFVDRQPPKFNLNCPQSLPAGIVLAIAMFVIIVGSYWLIGKSLLNIADIRASVKQTGMNIPFMVYGFGTFQTLINSFIEEYAWRWFVYRKCGTLVKTDIAIYLSALFFTLHHIIIIVPHVDDMLIVTIGTLAVFIAGVIWAKMFRVYRSLLPIYISHAAADLALQIVSWDMLLR